MAENEDFSEASNRPGQVVAEITASVENQNQKQMSQQSTNAQEIPITKERKVESATSITVAGFNCGQRIFKKTSQNNKLTLYLASRDLVISGGKIDKLQGVLVFDRDVLQDKQIYGQVTLTFRYGREDEEVMGLKFCNEAIMSLKQLHPPYPSGPEYQEPNTPLQEALVNKFGANAHPFSMALMPLAPPSVQLVPAKEYNGAPIGTSYDVRVYVADRPDEKLIRKTTMVRMGIRVIQGPNSPPSSNTVFNVPSTTRHSLLSRMQGCDSQKIKVSYNEITYPEIAEAEESQMPHAVMEKQFLLSDGRVRLEASLDRAIYSHGDPITVRVNVTNNSNKTVKRIEAFVVQHVDVCMFSNGKFKNIVAFVSSRDGCPVDPGFTLTRSYTLKPERSSTKNWIALEDSYNSKASGNLAATVVCSGKGPDDRNVFAIYVSYYVKVKLVISPIGEWIGGGISLKLPFTLMHSEPDTDLAGSPSPIRDSSRTLGKIVEDSKSSEDKSLCHNKEIYSRGKGEAITKTKEERMAEADLIKHFDESKST